MHLPRASHLPTHLILNAAHFTDRDSEAQQGELCPEMAGLGFAWSPSGSRGHTLSTGASFHMSVSGSPCGVTPPARRSAYEGTGRSHRGRVLTELAGWESIPIRPSGGRRRLRNAASSPPVGFWPRKNFGDAWAGFATLLHPAAAQLWWWADFWAPGTGEEECGSPSYHTHAVSRSLLSPLQAAAWEGRTAMVPMETKALKGKGLGETFSPLGAQRSMR